MEDWVKSFILQWVLSGVTVNKKHWLVLKSVKGNDPGRNYIIESVIAGLANMK